MNKLTLSLLQQEIEFATSALEQLEQAIEAGDNARIGAALYLLKSALNDVTKLLQEQ